MISVSTTAIVIIYTSIQSENDCFQSQIVKTWQPKILGVVDQLDKTIIK